MSNNKFVNFNFSELMEEIRKNYVVLGYSNKDSSFITIDEVNSALKDYMPIFERLLALKNEANNTYKQLDLEYEMWYLEKKAEVRDSFVNQTKKKATQAEVEERVTLAYGKEMREKIREINDTKSYFEAISDYVKIFSSYSNNLGNLSKNMKQELESSRHSNGF